MRHAVNCIARPDSSGAHAANGLARTLCTAARDEHCVTSVARTSHTDTHYDNVHYACARTMAHAARTRWTVITHELATISHARYTLTRSMTTDVRALAALILRIATVTRARCNFIRSMAIVARWRSLYQRWPLPRARFVTLGAARQLPCHRLAPIYRLLRKLTAVAYALSAFASSMATAARTRHTHTPTRATA